ncbi:MAG TPA: undecaprenyl-diphosphate phosphatase [Pirellulales bacterium]|jgi:undecaprenyl-diphosphatase
MEYLRIIILGIVQGITEFLPISSDGHLVVADQLIQKFSSAPLSKPNIVVTIILHLGTLAAILIVYREQILRLLTKDRRVIGLLIVGTIPAAISGLLLEELADQYMVNPLLTGCLLPLNGLLLLFIDRKKPGETDYENLRYGQALFIGCCQAFAPLPGISRSGTTIAGGLAAGMRRDAAATFSFLLAIPAIGGAVTVAFLKLFLKGADGLPSVGVLTVGAVVSFLVGLVSLRLLLRLLREGLLDPFAYWCIALGIGVIIWQLAT